MESLLADLRRISTALALISMLPAAASAGTGFVLGWNLPEGADSHWVALGDVDGDFDIDAYVTEFYGPDVLWLNDGDGLFSRSAQVLDSGYGSCALLAPLDNNGSLDLFLARHLASNRVWFNDGAGTLSRQRTGDRSRLQPAQRRPGRPRRRYGPGRLHPCQLADRHQRGLLQQRRRSLHQQRTDARQLLQPCGRPGQCRQRRRPRRIDRQQRRQQAVEEQRRGVFTDSGQTVGTGGTFDVELADLDGDTDLDAFFANGSTSGDPNEVWLNDGLGNFTDSGQNLDDDYSFSVVLFLCDGDADLDAFVGNNTGQPNRLYLNNGAGVLTDSGQDLGIGGAISVAASDLDGDTDLDLFLANINQPEQVFWNDGACQFEDSGQLLGGSAAESVDLGDIDGDGDLDAAVGGYGGITRVFRNDGLGSFTDDNQWLGNGFGPATLALRLADLDGDDDLDLWTALCCSGGVAADDPGDRIWLNDGGGIFTDSGQALGSESTLGGALGDVDGDLDLDIVVANYPSVFSPGTNRLYLNDGGGIFTQSPQSLGTANNKAVALGRLDGDADLDLFVGVRGGPSKVWSNDGTGTFTVTPQSLGNASTNAVALGDLNGDGDLDAFLANSGGNTVWFNGGNGHFTDSAQLLGSADTVAVHLFDADGDGDLDAWATNGDGSTQASAVWLNDGDGLFTDSGWALPSMQAGKSAMGNLDGDLDPDVLVVSFFGDHQVWLNQYSGPIFIDGFELGNMNAWSAVVP